MNRLICIKIISESRHGYRIVSYDENGAKNHAISIDIKKKMIKIICDMKSKENVLIKNIKMQDVIDGDFDEETIKIACEKLQVPYENVLYTIKNISQNYNEYIDTILAPEVSKDLTKLQAKFEVVDIFYKKVLAEFANKKLNFHGHEYNIGFSSILKKDEEMKIIGNEEDEVVLKIDDFKKFSNKLLELIEIANTKNIKWLKSRENFTQQEKIEHILKQIWFNATIDDYKNPESYLELQKRFIQDTTFENLDNGEILGSILSLNGHILKVKREEQSGSNETPYMLNFDLIDKENKNIFCDLPSVRYVVDRKNNIAYIYAIQKRKNNKEASENPENIKFQKKVNKMLFKLNKGVLETESPEFQEIYRRRLNKEDILEYEVPENISDVTPAFLISMTATIGLLKKEGITNIMIPREMPLRIQVHRRFDQEKRKRIDNNVTKKFIRVFRRLDKHLKDLNFEESYDSSYVKINLEKNLNKSIIDSEILDEIYSISEKNKIEAEEEKEIV